MNLVDSIINFLFKNKLDSKLVVAGKNFGSFDVRFLRRLPKGEDLVKCFSHRILDAGPMFVDFNTDNVLPDLKLSKERAGISGDVLHDSLDDAWDVIQVLRTKY
jgi:hypothetical protein